MKLNKKLVVGALSTVMGLSVTGAISGTFAWYQYSTRATASLIGLNTADTGVLEVSADGTNFKRDLVAADLLDGRADSKITPVTFGMVNNGEALPAQAYKRPDLSLNSEGAYPGSYAQVYEEADSDHDYIQYDVYVRARKVKNAAGGFENVEKDVYFTDIVLEDENHKIDSALRVHLAIDENNDGNADKNFLFARSAVNGLQLYGVLDLDNDDHPDIKGGYQWVEHREDLVYYGNEGDFQNAIAMSDLKADKESDKSIDPEHNVGKKLFTTSASNAVKVTVTVWLEGWDNTVAEHRKSVSMVSPEKNIYVLDESIKGEDLTGKGLFTRSADAPYTYTVAAGLAEEGEAYYAVHYRKVHLDKNDAIPANTFRASADASAAFVAAGTVSANDGVDYFVVVDRDVSSTLRRSLADTSAYYTESAGVYTEATGPVDGAETYYRKLVEASGTEAVAATAETDAESVEGLYTRSGDAGNYVFTEAHGRNVNGTAYYSLDDVTINDVPMWTGEGTDGVEFKFGLTFDVGSNAFAE